MLRGGNLVITIEFCGASGTIETLGTGLAPACWVLCMLEADLTPEFFPPVLFAFAIL